MFDDVHSYLMIATAVIFLVLIYILNKILFKPLLKFMDERSTSIASNLAKVKEDDDEIQAFEEELKQIHAKAILEADRIREEIVDEARTKAEASLRKKQVELDLDLAKFYKELQSERTAVYASLEKDLASFEQSYIKTLKNI